jgi:branched-chain amino acid transport system ATP-binding protein
MPIAVNTKQATGLAALPPAPAPAPASAGPVAAVKPAPAVQDAPVVVEAKMQQDAGRTLASGSPVEGTQSTAPPILSVNNIEVIYDHVILVLKGVSLQVPKGRIVALLGANGAGKSTTLKSISNLIRAERGDVTKGSILFEGTEVHSLTPNELVRRGCIQVMEGRHCFAHLDVEENLLTGAYTRRDGAAAVKADLEMVYNYFPRLKQRRSALAGYISGGEQQMTAIGRALMSRPKTMLLDEPSMGLAPQLVEEIFEIVKRLNQEQGVSVLLAEQNTNIALRYADYGYILENGRVVLDGEAKALRENEDVKEFYLGISGENRKSFRNVKHYKRRKRWLA